MKNHTSATRFIPLLSLLLLTPLGASAQDTSAECKLKGDMRSLWVDHVVFTHAYVTSAVGDLGDVGPVTDRLMANQDAIGQAIEPYYGSGASDRLASLLREHIQIATQVVKAARFNDPKGLKYADKKWHMNADDIAAFLSKANPNLPQGKLKDMLYKHLSLLTDAVKARIDKRYTDEIKSYDEGAKHMQDFADTLTDGIVKQFNNKFAQR
jgi:hypothetical protein